MKERKVVKAEEFGEVGREDFQETIAPKMVLKVQGELRHLEYTLQMRGATKLELDMLKSRRKTRSPNLKVFLVITHLLELGRRHLPLCS